MYQAFFGFSEKPFEVTPDPKFIYLTPSHREAFNTMLNGIKNRWGFVSVTGEVGTGKTTLIHFLLSQLGPGVKTVFIFNTLITFHELLRTALSDLDQEVSGKNPEVLTDQLKSYLYQHLPEGETLAFIIDESQNLSEDLLRDLGDFLEQDPRIMGRLQVIFVGQPEFTRKLQAPGLRGLGQRIRVCREIQPFTEDESRAYIEHRLRLVGSSIEKVFTPRAISMVIRQGEGFPRRINILCDNAFLMGYGSSRAVVDVDILRDVVRDLDGLPKRKTASAGASRAAKENSGTGSTSRLNRKKAILGMLLLMGMTGLIILFRPFTEKKPEKRWSKDAIMQKPVPDEQETRSPLSLPAEPANPSKKDLRPDVSTGAVPVPESRDLHEEVIVVEKDQNLSSLAQKYYRTSNTTLVDLLMESNPEITNVHLIRVDQKLKIPKISMEWLIRPSPDRSWQIHAGTFGSSTSAESYREEPVLRGKKVEVSARRVSPQETWYRVFVGTYETREEALKAAGLLKERGLLPVFGGAPGSRPISGSGHPGS